MSSPFSARRSSTSSRPRRSGGGRPGSARGSSRRPQNTPVAPVAAAPEQLWTVPDSGMPTFAELGLPTPIVTALARAGFTEPFPIQAATLPDTLAGRDLLGRGQTGSGKTLAFGLAMLARLDGGRSRPRQPRGLVLVPTRELAQQVVDALAPFAKAIGLDRDLGGRRHVVQPPGRRAEPRRRPADRHPRPAHRPHRPAHLRPLRGLRDRARRGRPDGRHGLPAAGAADPRPDPGRRAAAAVLGHPRRCGGHAGQPVPGRPGHPLDRLGHRAGVDHGAPRADGGHRGEAAGDQRDRGPGRAHDPVRAHQARRRPAGEGVAPQRHRRRRAARRQGAERAQPGDRRVQGRADAGPGGDRRGRPRHPRRRRQPGRARRPAGRPEGLPAPRRAHRAGRRLGHRGDHRDPAGAGRGGPAHPARRGPRDQHAGAAGRPGSGPDHRRPHPVRGGDRRAAQAGPAAARAADPAASRTSAGGRNGGGRGRRRAA